MLPVIHTIIFMKRTNSIAVGTFIMRARKLKGYNVPHRGTAKKGDPIALK
jgi:hypothetical protein